MPQPLHALLPTVLVSEIQAALDKARTDLIASLEGKMTRMIERVAPTILRPLFSDFQVLVEKKMFHRVQSLVDNQLPNTDVLVSTVRTKVEGVPPVHPLRFPYETQHGYLLEDAVKELMQEPYRATVPSPSKAYPTGIGEQPLSGSKAM